jgi:hypothetical protein
VRTRAEALGWVGGLLQCVGSGQCAVRSGQWAVGSGQEHTCLLFLFYALVSTAAYRVPLTAYCLLLTALPSASTSAKSLLAGP